jgi:hypothetical protein
MYFQKWQLSCPEQVRQNLEPIARRRGVTANDLARRVLLDFCAREAIAASQRKSAGETA